MFHNNVWSLNKNFDDLEYLLKCANKKFDIVAVTAVRITRINTSKLCNIRLKNYTFDSNPTESSAGGTLLYIAIPLHLLSYKPHNDLNIKKNLN